MCKKKGDAVESPINPVARSVYRRVSVAKFAVGTTISVLCINGRGFMLRHEPIH
jgi:hypothetical protein